jgi:hypothetical protein
MSSFDDFFRQPENMKYKQLKESSVFEEIFDYLQQAESIDKMMRANEQGRPPLEGIIDWVEAKNDSDQFDMRNFNHLRQAVGAMIKYVLKPFGYRVGVQKKISGTKIFKSATHYVADERTAIKRLVRKVYIEDCG